MKPNPTIIKNPQANSNLERVHEVLGNMLRTKNLQKYDFDDMDPQSELLASVTCAICSTHHTTLQATPGQLVFGRNMLSNLKFVPDWEAISLRQQKDVDRNNSKENTVRRINHDYQVGDKVIITNNDIHRDLNCPTKGPYPIVQVYSNSTVRVQNGAVTKRFNIRRCSPYTDQHKFGEECRGSSSDTTANKINTYYLIG